MKIIITALIISNIFQVVLYKTKLKNVKITNYRKEALNYNQNNILQAELRTCDYRLELFLNCEKNDNCSDIEKDVSSYLKQKGFIR